MLRALFIGIFFFTMTPILISAQWLLGKLNLPGWGFIASNYYRVLRALLRIRVSVVGNPVRDRAVLFVSNHVSWIDIVVIGSITPVAFVAKREVASWPLVGVTAKMQRTVFVDRGRRHQTGDAVSEISTAWPRAHPSSFSPKEHRVTATVSCRSAPRCSVRSRTKAGAQVF